MTLPDSVSITGAVKHAARVIPGTASLVLHSPRIVASPILNTFAPAYYTSDKALLERWSDPMGGAMIGTAIGTAIGASSGSMLGGAALGAMLGPWLAVLRSWLISFVEGYAAAISDAYMKGARVADGSVNFARGLVGLDAK